MTVARLRANAPMRAPVRHRTIVRRRRLVNLGKFVLPAIALALLAALVVWPELNRDADKTRMSYRRLGVTPQSGELAEPRYRGVDSDGQPYTITATRARQSEQGRTDMVEPRADMTQQSGVWLMLQAKSGVYLPRDGALDMQGEVSLYRDDGLMLQSNSATIDLHQGAANGAEQVHVEGPFGTLDAQSFVMLDKGALIRFNGPARLVLNGGSP